MKLGDLLFYHSNIGKEIVGIVKVIEEALTHQINLKFVAVKVKFEKKLKKPVTLQKIKKTSQLKQLPLIKQSRLSVMPIDLKSWNF